MLAPGRYIINAIVRYSTWGGFNGFTPNTFANKLRESVQRDLGGKARMTENLPFNPFVQTYKKSGGWFGSDHYYALITIFLSVEQYLDEQQIKPWMGKAFGQSIRGEHMEFGEPLVRGFALAMSACPSTTVPANINAEYEGPYQGCMSLGPDPGVTWDNWEAQDAQRKHLHIWLHTYPGYESWEHTNQQLTPAQPQPQPAPPPPAPAPPAPGPTGGGTMAPPPPLQITQPPGGAGGGTVPSIWSEPGVKVAVGAAAVAVVGVIVWSVLSKPTPTPRPAAAGRRANRRRTR